MAVNQGFPNRSAAWLGRDGLINQPWYLLLRALWIRTGGASDTAVVVTGAPSAGQLAFWSTPTSITDGNLSGDVATSGSGATTISTGAVTTTKIGNLAVTTAKIAASNVTLAKIQNAAANSKLLGSGASGSGVSYSEISLGSGLSISGTTITATGSGGTVTHTGALTSGQLLIGNGGADITALPTTVNFATAGAVFADGSGNLTSGAVLRQTSSPSNPAGTTSATQVMMGLAVSATPAKGTALLVTVSGDGANSLATDGFTVALRFGTGTAPANGAAATGTQLSLTSATNVAAAGKVPFALTGLMTGLTAGTAYWLDLGLLAVLAGTASVADLTITVVEV